MKTFTSASITTLTTFAIASLFSLTASATNLSNSDYESYAQSSVWPSHSTSVSKASGSDLSSSDYETYADSSSFPSSDQSSAPAIVASMTDIQNTIEQNPTAAGSSNVLLRDLAGEDIHAQ